MDHRITRLINGSVVPISEDRFEDLFANNEEWILENSTVKVWRDVFPSAQSTYINSVWSLLEESLHFKSHYQNLYPAVLELEELRFIHDQINLVPMVVSAFSKYKMFMPISDTWFEIYLREPGVEENSNFYLDTFPLAAWVMQLVLILVVLVIIWTSSFILAKTSLKRNRITILDCIFHVLSLIANQGPMVELSSYTLRAVTYTVLLSGFLVSVFYSALLVAKQSISIADPPFSTLQGLKKAGTHQLCMAENSFAREMFEISNHEPEWANIINGDECPKKREELLAAVCHHDIASMVLFQHLTNTDGFKIDNCVLKPFKEKYFEEPAYISSGHKFPHAQRINQELSRFRSFGLLQYLWLKCRRPVAPLDDLSNELPRVSLLHVKGLLTGYAAGACFAVLLLCCEILFHWKMWRPPHSDTSVATDNYCGPNGIPYRN